MGKKEERKGEKEGEKETSRELNHSDLLFFYALKGKIIKKSVTIILSWWRMKNIDN